MENHRIGVVGLGLLGRTVAACFLGHGFRVVGYMPSQQEHLEARRQIEHMVVETVGLPGCDLELTRTERMTGGNPATARSAFAKLFAGGISLTFHQRPGGRGRFHLARALIQGKGPLHYYCGKQDLNLHGITTTMPST